MNRLIASLQSIHIYTRICILFFMMPGMPYAHAQVTNPEPIRLRGVSLQEALPLIESQTNLHFSYSPNSIDMSQKISCDCSPAPSDLLLPCLFAKAQLQYERKGTMVVLYAGSASYRQIEGKVTEQGTGERLIGAIVASRPAYAASVTNTEGHFSLTLHAEVHEISVSLIGYKPQIISLKESREPLAIVLEPVSDLAEVLITASKEERGLQTDRLVVPLHEIKWLPAMLGEKDVVRQMMLSGGIQKGNEGNGYMYVRGGGPDQNLVLVDDAVIYNVYHLLGLSSLFSGNELRHAELIKGGFSARYGGRLSSVMNLTLRDGNSERVSADATIGAISSRIMLELPLVPKQASILCSFRRSYLGGWSGVAGSESDAVLNYGYYDLHTKLTTLLGKRDKISLSAYFGNDLLDNQSVEGLSAEQDGIQWGNRAMSLRWSHQLNAQWNTSFVVVNSYYKSRIAFADKDGTTGDVSSSDVQSEITDYTLRNNWEWQPHRLHTFRFGGEWTHHRFTNSSDLNQITLNQHSGNSQHLNAIESAVYGEWAYNQGKHWELITGLRLSNYALNHNWTRMEPRIKTLYHLTPTWQWSASYALMNQYLHLVSAFNGLGLPSDAWVPTAGALEPQRAHLITTGMVGNDIRNSGISLGIEAYYKSTEQAVSLKEGASFFQVIPNALFNQTAKTWSELITQGNARSYGIECTLRKYGLRYQLQVSYTLSKTSMQFPMINYGEVYPATHDRRHDLGINMIYHVGKKLHCSVNWIYGSGFAITLPTGEYYAVPHDPASGPYTWLLYDYSGKNSARMRDYHRLDISVTYQFSLYKKVESAIEFSIYNCYNRANPFYYQIEHTDQQSGTGPRKLQQVSLFPLMPSLSWNIKL